jgi:hypothetical protein
LGGLDLPEASVKGLAPGESSYACWSIGHDLAGALPAAFHVDFRGDVDEMLEDNNVLLETIYLEDLVREGPVLHVRGLEDDNLWLIKYDDSIGMLSGTSTLTLVWGMDDWRLPEEPTRKGREVDGRYESPMRRGLDGLWYVIVPNQPGESLVFRFRDQMGNGSNWDDNSGLDWKILRTEWVLGLMAEYDRVVESGIALGANMTQFVDRATNAWAHYQDGDLTGAFELAEGYVLAGITYVAKLRDLALDDVNSARELGIPAEKYERDLMIAGRILDAGKYDTAEGYCDRVISAIAEEKAKIPDLLGLPLFLLSLLSVALLNRRSG